MNWAGWVLVAYFVIGILFTAYQSAKGVAEHGRVLPFVVGFAIYTAFNIGLIALTFTAAQG